MLLDTVVKLGGGVLSDAELFNEVLGIIGTAARRLRLVIVPGGGPFADAVRAIDRRLALSDDTAHWMAVLAMDQYAHLIASRLNRGVVVEMPAEITNANPDHVPVLAPSRWLRQADPLPHAWTVTSDSIAAWVAGSLGVSRLVLVKPPGTAPTDGLLDDYFGRALPPHVTPVVVPADRLDELRSALQVDGA